MKHYGFSILALGTVKSNGNKKVYVANKNLEKSLPAGTKVHTQYDATKREIILEKCDSTSANHTISAKPNGTPVLDLKNKNVGETIGDVEKIEIQFYKDKVVIKVPKTTLQKEQRAKKSELSIFEIFSGAGTLSNLFEGNLFEGNSFVSKGALEINEKNMAIFHKNHKDEDVFTVQANIEDVDMDLFPKDVTVALVTPVCTDSSLGNKVLKTALKNKREGKEYDKEAVERLERSDSLMYYALKAIDVMNPKTIVFENVEGYTKDPYNPSLERGIYTLTKTILKAKGYKLSEHVGQSHNTIRKRWVMIAHYGDKPISLDDLKIDQTQTTIGELLAVPDSKREWGTKSDFAPSRLSKNKVGIRSVELDDYVTNTFSTHATRADFPILHKEENGVDLYSTFTPEDIKNIHGLSKDFILPEQKTVAYRVLGQGVASMFKDVAKTILEHYKKEYSDLTLPNEINEPVNNTEFRSSLFDNTIDLY